MTEFITGAAGSGKSTLMTEKISDSSKKGRKICVIVPEQFSQEFDKSLYNKIGAVAYNRLLSQSFTGLARCIFQKYGDIRSGKRYADDTVRMTAVYLAIGNFVRSTDYKGSFHNQYDSAGFMEEILKLSEELKRAGISPDSLNQVSQNFDNWKFFAKLNDIAGILLEYERLLGKYGFKDASDDIMTAAEAASMYGFFKDMDVFIDEFESFTGSQKEMLKVILAQSENVYITLRSENVKAGKYSLFRTVNNTYRTLASLCSDLGREYSVEACENSYRFKNPDVAYLSANIMRPGKSGKFKTVPDPGNIRIFEASDPYIETEYICAEIRRLIYSDSTLKCRDIAVISDNIEDYSGILEAVFKRFSIPYWISAEKPVSHTPVMNFLSSLMDIISSRRLSTDTVLRHLKSGLTDISEDEIDRIEEFCFKWGIDGDHWVKLFDKLDKSDDSGKIPDEDKKLTESLKKLKRLEDLRKSVSKKMPAVRMCKCIYDYITDCGAEKNTVNKIDDFIENNMDYAASETKRLWSCMIDMLDSIAGTFGEIDISAAELSRIIHSLIGRIKYSVTPPKLDHVIVASASTVRLPAPRVVFILGATDGKFPEVSKEYGLISNAEKQELIKEGIEISRKTTDIVADERLAVYKSLSAASEKLFITYPLTDLSGQPQYPSSVIDEIIGLFEGKLQKTTTDTLGRAYTCVTKEAAFYRYMQDMKRNTAETATVEKILAEDEIYRDRVNNIRFRAGEKRDFHISTSDMEKLVDFDPLYIWPTGFEDFNKCSFDFFCKNYLKLNEPEKRDLNPINLGNVMHKCFEEILKTRKKDEFINLSGEEIKKDIDKYAQDFLDRKMGGDFAKSEWFSLEFEKMKQNLVEIFVHSQNELKNSEFVPKEFEFRFNENEGSDIRLEFAGGKELSLKGKIDRVDTLEKDGKNYVCVFDYKSSKKDVDEAHLNAGLNMQPLLYLFAITQKGTRYENYIPSGAFYSPSDIKIKPENDHKREKNETVVNKNLKSSGIVLGDKETAEDIYKEAIKTDSKTKINNMPGKYINAIVSDSFEELREFSYEKLRNMAETIYSGNIEANPIVHKEDDKERKACEYCGYKGICGFEGAPRNIKDADVSRITNILSDDDRKEKKEDNENGTD